MSLGNIRTIEIPVTADTVIDHALTFLYGSGILRDAENNRDDVLETKLKVQSDGNFKLTIKFKKEPEVRTTKYSAEGKKL